MEQYPLPKPGDQFASPTDGKKLNMLDLTHAYQRMLLQDEAQQYLNVSTHKGLYKYLRIPFGVASASVNF